MALDNHECLVDLAVRVIDRFITRPDSQSLDSGTDEVDKVISSYVEKYSRLSVVPSYTDFDACGDRGVQRLVQVFTDFDPVNAVGPFRLWTETNIPPSHLEMQHVFKYMSAPEFSSDLLKTLRYDRVVNAIFSYILPWTDEALVNYGERHPQFKTLVLSLSEERKRAPVYTITDGDKSIPFIRASFRLLVHYFKRLDRTQGTDTKVDRPTFCIQKYVPTDWITHFRDVYQKLLNESLNQQDIERLEMPIRSPFTRVALKYSGAGYHVNAPVKVITGQACCGKTTLLENLKIHGWTICSRGDLGTFSGKAKSPPAIAGLHAALENALTRGDVLGDRGAIDNPLWTIIMTLCDPQYKERVIDELMTFFNGTINEHVAAYMNRQQVIVFIDPYPSLNRARMLKRSTDGDAFRARIHMYPITQCIAYYMAARLYGWTVRCVPYNERRELQPQHYKTLADEISAQFGKPFHQQPLEVASKPDGYYLDDKEYSIATGIFK